MRRGMRRGIRCRKLAMLAPRTVVMFVVLRWAVLGAHEPPLCLYSCVETSVYFCLLYLRGPPSPRIWRHTLG